MNVTKTVLVWLSLVGCALAQGDTGTPVPSAPAHDEASSGEVASPPRLSDAARAALSRAKGSSQAVRGLRGPERTRALELAAVAYDKVVADFTDEPRAAGAAAWAAALLWRSHGSLALAEQDYLRAAKCDPQQNGQRGLLGAADMQRRQHRVEEAMKTYVDCEKIDPRTTRAQDARLWLARMLLDQDQVDAAIERFQLALESAPTPSQAIDAADFLAKAWIQKGDLDAAQFVIEHAEQIVLQAADEAPEVVSRLERACDGMSARRALQRARDEANGAAQDAVRFDQQQRGGCGTTGGGAAGGGDGVRRR
ncbi:MAG: tetratricopeptide repeat protein [Planctomycetes bacterium]|nr:tetratricopeptide repeat protein [Planctomycetota bacterium]